MRIYQTDFEGYIKQYGCLFFDLINIASKISNSKVRKHDVIKIYNKLTDDGCMNNKCYIKNHEEVLQIILMYFGSDKTVTYSGAQYLESDDSWGSNSGDYMIMQLNVVGANSHFVQFDNSNIYNPWRGQMETDGVKSIRYYTIN